MKKKISPGYCKPFTVAWRLGSSVYSPLDSCSGLWQLTGLCYYCNYKVKNTFNVGRKDSSGVKSIFALADDPDSIPYIYMVTRCHLELPYEGIQHPLLTSEDTGHTHGTSYM